MAAPDLLQRLDLAAPIVQAPMAGTATPALAAAVSNAGGLGSIGIATATVDQARSMIAETRARSNKSFNVNVFCHQPAKRDVVAEARWLAHLAPLFVEVGAAPPTELHDIYPSFLGNDDAFRMLLETAPAVVSFHFGLPGSDRIAALKERGIITFATATNPAEARQAEAAGIDAIVAQGIEAGGHRGIVDLDAVDERLSTAGLLQLLVRQTALPVIAAGGIMDGRGIRAALELGAAAAQLGTAFILCPESAASAEYRANLQAATAAVTRLTGVVSGRPARGLVNRLMRHGEAPGSPPHPAYPVAYDATKRLAAAAKAQGRDEFSPHWAGQGAPLARAMPAADLMAVLRAEMQV